MKTISPSHHREIITSGSLKEINKWIADQWMHIPKHKEILIERIREMKVTISPRYKDECHESDINTFYYLLTSRPKFTKDMYDLLNVMTNSCIFPDYGYCADYLTSSKISPWTNILILSLTDIDKIRKERYKCFEDEEEKILYLFYMKIIDIYLPCHNPQAFVTAMQEFSSLSNVINEAGNTDRILKRFSGCSGMVNKKLIVLLHKIILDIYTNEESSYDFLEKLYYITTTSFYSDDRINEMMTRYRRYISTDHSPDFFFNSLFSLLSNGWSIVPSASTYDLNENIEAFLREFSYDYSKSFNISVMRVLLHEIAGIIQSKDCYHMKENNIQYVMNYILERWGSKEYEVSHYISNECILLPTDKPITTLDELNQIAETDVAMEAKEVSAKMNNAERKIYKAYRTYKENEEKVDSQITKGVNGIKNVLTGDVREEIIEGKKFSAIGLLKKLLGGVALFSFSKITFAVALVTRFALKKSTTDSERSKILMEIDTEIAMLEEKINDAKSDQNREAKYAMMRTKKELENAKVRIQYGMSADTGSLSKTKKTLDQSRRERGVS